MHSKVNMLTIRYQSETETERRKRIRTVLSILRNEFPQPSCALLHENPLQLLIATILSAQCTDARVNKVTPDLFAKYPDVGALASAPLSSLMEIIRSTGFFRNKAVNIHQCAQAIQKKHDGKIPRTMDELVALPGVGRKTANVVLGTAFGIPGLPVDTHVKRISNLLGFTDSENPEKIEQQLCAIIPKKDWIDASHLFILHGRKTCIARRPKCWQCTIQKRCPSRQS